MALSVLLAPDAAATEVGSVHLTDGTIIRGALVSISGGTSAVRSESLGALQIPVDRIASVVYVVQSSGMEPVAFEHLEPGN